MSVGRDLVIELLNEIRMELEVQSTRNTGREINMGNLLELTSVMPNRLMTSGLDSGTITAIQTCMDHIDSEATTPDNLKARLVDVNRILSILTRT